MKVTLSKPTLGEKLVNLYFKISLQKNEMLSFNESIVTLSLSELLFQILKLIYF